MATQIADGELFCFSKFAVASPIDNAKVRRKGGNAFNFCNKYFAKPRKKMMLAAKEGEESNE